MMTSRLLQKYPMRVPVMMHKRKSDKVHNELMMNNKFLIPKDQCFFHLFQHIRSHVKLRPADTIFVYTNDNRLVTGDMLVASLYEKSKSSDEILHLFYTVENVFG